MIVRFEREDSGKAIGLFSNIFVERESRRAGDANSLLLSGEAWMLRHGVAEAVTCTSDTNVKLINLFRKHGYQIAGLESQMVQLTRALTRSP